MVVVVRHLINKHNNNQTLPSTCKEDKLATVLTAGKLHNKRSPSISCGAISFMLSMPLYVILVFQLIQFNLIQLPSACKGNLKSHMTSPHVKQVDLLCCVLLMSDPCDLISCQNGATCQETVQDYVCVCTADFTGPSCEDPCKKRVYTCYNNTSSAYIYSTFVLQYYNARYSRYNIIICHDVLHYTSCTAQCKQPIIQLRQLLPVS